MQLFNFICLLTHNTHCIIAKTTGKVLFSGNTQDIPARWLLKTVKSFDIWKEMGTIEIRL